MNASRLYVQLSYIVLCWDKATLVKKWRADNPGESRKLDHYIANGGDPPSLFTPTGQALVDTWTVLKECEQELRIDNRGGDGFSGEGVA